MIVVAHRKNKTAQLGGLVPGTWIEIDLDSVAGEIRLTHDAWLPGTELPETFEAVAGAALAAGVAGFVLDCKREAVEPRAKEVLARLGHPDHFWLNEMEVQADIYGFADPHHQGCLRIWEGRPARAAIDFLSRRADRGKPFPRWIWADGWTEGLAGAGPAAIAAAPLPLSLAEVSELAALNVRVCLCSPELYAHSYAVSYTPAEAAAFADAVAAWRRPAEAVGAAMVCTKFPAVWMA